jgi:eukaryotic-like serine/threonine-protein kinase
MPPLTDTLPPRYREPQPIGAGGMGEIFRATDGELGREVAVKVLAARYSEDVQLRARFKREALAAARLSGHANIVTIFDVTEHERRPMIVMEYLSGGSLEERVRDRSPVPPAQVLEWLEEAGSALDAAHEAGIVHRDVKPGNLLLDEHGRVHVADFGIASAAGMDSFTKTGTILGTAGYLSPEQARGERAGPASDLYALAIVAWELLTGRRPFQADTPTVEAAAHVNTPVPSIHATNSSLPRSFDQVFERALAKDPSSRFPTAIEFVQELRQALHDDAGDTGWIEPVPRTTAVTQAAPPARDNRRWLIPALLVLLLGAGVLAAVLALGDDSPRKAAAPEPRTVVRTITSPGQTIRQTVTAQPPPATTTGSKTTAAGRATGSGATLNNAGYTKMQQGDFAGALPLLEQAVSKLQSTGSLDEAYADYNLAYTRYALGQCTDVLALLDHSEAIQGPRKPIDHLRKQAAKRC